MTGAEEIKQMMEKMRENPEEGLREYYNKFTKDGGDGQPFKRASILRNSEPIKPLLRNEGNKKRHIGLFYDPARSFDNSIFGDSCGYYRNNNSNSSSAQERKSAKGW